MLNIKLSKNIKIYRPPPWLVKRVKGMFTISNPKYFENSRMGRWNGNTPRELYYFTEYKNRIELPIGGLDYLRELLKRKKIKTEYTNTCPDLPVKIQFTGDLRAFQLDAMEKVLKHKNGALVAPTGSGKTVMGIFSICYRKQKTLIIVHTIDLARQWVDRLTAFTNLKAEQIGMIGDKQFRIGEEVTVSLIQSLRDMAGAVEKEFGHVLVDECHRSPSKTFTHAISSLHAKHKLGLTATPVRRDGLSKLIEWHCGNIRANIPKKMLIKEGFVLQPKFIVKETDFTCSADSQFEYSKMLTNLCSDPGRNKLICDLICKLHKEREDLSCVVLTDRKYHCADLSFRLKKRKVDCLTLTGDVKGEERENIIEQMNNGECKILLATGQLLGEGFDCKELNVLVLASPIKFKGRVTQYIGRIMRPGKDNKQPIVYDFADWNVGVLAKSAQARIRTYGKENTIIE